MHELLTRSQVPIYRRQSRPRLRQHRRLPAERSARRFAECRRVVQWARQASLLDRQPVHFSAKQFGLFRKVREELHGLFHFLAHGAPPSDHLLAPLITRLAAIAPRLQILREQGALTRGWDLVPRDPERILAAILSSAADLLVSGQAPRLRQCEDATCGWLFLDRSQAGRRRWCSMADCGNRAKVRAHYRRQTHASPAQNSPG